MDPFLSLVMLAVLPVIFAVVYFVSLWGVRLYKNVQKSVDGMIRVVREDSQGIRVIKALSRVEREHQRYDKVNKKLVSDEKKANLTLGFVNPVMNLLMNLGITFVVLLGAYRVMGRKTDPGVIIAFTQYFTMISTATLSITRIFMMYTRSTASAARIQQVVDAPRELTALSEADYPIKEENGYIVFENVSFSYGGKGNHLKNISFSLPRGQTLGIIGGTGSGKTTLINLLMRFYDLDGGNIYIDGVNAKDIPLDEYRKLFGMVLQESFLCNETVAWNIAYGNEHATREEVEAAAKAAYCDFFIRNMEHGYDTVLSGNSSVSQGERQLLCIARVMLADPPMLILDEATSNIDTMTELRIQKAFRKIMHGRTSFIVAHRLSTILDADLILVMKDGAVIEQGTHAQLMERRGFYCDLYNAQFAQSAHAHADGDRQ